jgi:hypothetical protein
MSNEARYKHKYEQLKAKFMNSVDVAFRLGFEQGALSAQMDAMAQQAQQAQQQAQASQQAAQSGAPGQDGEEEQDPSAAEDGSQEEQAQSPQEAQMGSELDKHISELESLLAKGELEPEELRKSLDSIKKAKEAVDLEKNLKAIKKIGKFMKPHFKLNKIAEHNLPREAKNALSTQEKILEDVMKSWDEAEARASKDIRNILLNEGLVKKD